MNRITMAIIALSLAMIISLGGIGAEPVSGGESPPNIRDLQGDTRDMDIFEEDHRVFINSGRAEPESRVNIKFSVVADDELSLDIGYSEMGDDNLTTESLHVKIMALVEFEDVDEDHTWGMGEPVSSFYPLSTSFLRSDLVMGTNDWEGYVVGDDIEYNYDVLGDVEHQSGYRIGFSLGWDWGLEGGSNDSINQNEYKPYPFKNISKEDLFDKISYFGIERMREDGVTKERIREYYKILFYGVAQGYQDGFKKGYDRGFRMNYVEEPRDVRSEDERAAPEEERQRPTPDDSLTKSREIKTGIYGPMTIDTIGGEEGDTGVRISLSDRREVFGLTCRISNDFYLEGKDFLSPASMKFDIDIQNYPYMANNTDIAVLMDVVVRSGVEEKVNVEDRELSYERSMGFAQDEKEIRMGSSNFKGFLSWSNVATCDGVVKDVNVERTQSISGADLNVRGAKVVNTNGVIMTYDRSISINHDPKLGFIEVLDQSVYEKASYGNEDDSALRSDLTMFLASTLVVLILVAVTWRARRRR